MHSSGRTAEEVGLILAEDDRNCSIKNIRNFIGDRREDELAHWRCSIASNPQRFSLSLLVGLAQSVIRHHPTRTVFFSIGGTRTVGARTKTFNSQPK